ncbi:MAG: zinc-ribbon domain-containing protein [Rhodothermales bacterium]
MALVECRECGRDVSDEADKCPHCGAPPTTAARMQQIAWAVSMIGLIILLFAIFVL